VRDDLYLVHIVERLKRIEDYTEGGRDAFMRSRVVQDAVIRNLEVVGEAAKRVSEEVRVAHPGVPWRRLAGLRDVLIHQYMGVDLEQVWGAVELSSRELRRDIEAIVADLGAGGPRPT
jgi:uncharacterized protein with HEPN domain